MKRIIRKLLDRCGIEINVRGRSDEGRMPYGPITISSADVVDLAELSCVAARVPGMISLRAGELLYTLCYTQALQGDVVEIGSWQGRSTVYLGTAARESGNGSVYAVDHFEGNPGKKDRYNLNRLSAQDLKSKFLGNMSAAGLSKSVSLLNIDSGAAAKALEANTIRFLFIDGEHTERAVQRDIDLFVPRMPKGAYVVFDDFSEGFPGVVSAVDAFIHRTKPERVLTYRNLFVVIL